MDDGLLFAVHAAATLFMTGLIWFVQVVHYPLFGRVGASAFSAYEQSHTRRTTWVVGPPMIVEAVAAGWIGIASRAPAALAWSGLALLAVAWLSTAFLQVPCHARLERSFDPAVHRRLVRTNWIRTVAWTARGVLALLMLGP